MNNDNQRQRKRVPISCLQCRRRKVKCDKQKPACGGCSRNGVGYQCQYLEPHWTTPQGNNPDYKDVVIQDKGSDINQIDELKRSKQNNERIIANQRKEIEDLRRQLSFTHQISGDVSAVNDNNDIKVITRLRNLSFMNNKSNLFLPNDEKILVMYLMQATDNGSGSTRNNMKSSQLYTWLDIIKLDPKLAAIWHKISNMQNIYRVYKASLKRTKRGISEIDFTHSVGSPSNDIKCPVVLCDFNFMTTTKRDSRSENENNDRNDNNKKSNVNDDINAPMFSPIDNNDPKIKNYLFQMFQILKKNQCLWNNLLHLPRSNDVLTASQLSFLFKFFFSDENTSTEKHLLSFFKDALMNKINFDEKLPSLNNSYYEHNCDQRNPLPIKGTGVCLSLIIFIYEYSFNYLSHKAKKNPQDQWVQEFQTLFGYESSFYGIDDKSQKLFKDIEDLLFTIVDINSEIDKSRYSFLNIVCVIIILKMSFKNPECSTSNRMSIFKLLLRILFGGNNDFEIWKDPSTMVLPNNESKKKIKDIRILSCYIWNEFVMCLNLISHALVSIGYYDDEIDNLIKMAHLKVEETRENQSHLKYISTLKSDDFDQLVTSLNVNYLLSKSHLLLTRGVMNLSGPKLTFRTLDCLIGEQGSWLEDSSLARLNPIIRIPLKVLLENSRFYMTYIMFLQKEDDKDDDKRKNFLIQLFARFDEFIKSVRISLIRHCDNREYQVFLLLISELLPVMIQILVALLLRINRVTDKHDSDEIYQGLKVIFEKTTTVTAKDLSSLIKTHVTDVVEDTIEQLINNTKHKNHQSLKVSQLWKFYVMIIESSEKFDFNYSKVHTNVPEFKHLINTSGNSETKIDKSFSKCPINHVNKDNTSSQSTEGKCPIDHTKFQKQKKRPTASSKEVNKKAKLDDNFNDVFEMDMFDINQPFQFDNENEGLIDLNDFAKLDMDFFENYTNFGV